MTRAKSRLIHIQQGEINNAQKWSKLHIHVVIGVSAEMFCALISKKQALFKSHCSSLLLQYNILVAPYALE
jgi:hypothetical protein